jgi:hypothetical protein
MQLTSSGQDSSAFRDRLVRFHQISQVERGVFSAAHAAKPHNVPYPGARNRGSTIASIARASSMNASAVTMMKTPGAITHHQ